jgi:hypothetical protein
MIPRIVAFMRALLLPFSIKYPLQNDPDPIPKIIAVPKMPW